MKKYKTSVILISMVSFVSLLFTTGCSLNKIYSYKAQGYCLEVSTADTKVQNDLIATGYSPGACSSLNALGTCTFTSTYGTSEVTVTSICYEGKYFPDAASAVSACALAGGVWTSDN